MKEYDISILEAPLSLAKRYRDESNENKYRNKFMRDRDRVLYSKSFRRLSGKTQVFLSGVDDHKRTRLTHTLEVSQIARTIARALNLNEDLVEAIALGHDLGHTPFGHIGERMLHEIMTPQYNHPLGKECPFNMNPESNTDFNIKEKYIDYLGFKHNLQGLKNVIMLEKNYDSKGLNLTNFTLFGIKSHSSCAYNTKKVNNGDCLGYYSKYINEFCILENNRFAWSLESFIVAEADEIAQRHHDVEDAIRGNLMTKIEISKILNDYFDNYLEDEIKIDLLTKSTKDDELFIATISRVIVDMYVTHLINVSKDNLLNFLISESDITNFSDVLKKYNYNDEKIINLISHKKFVDSDDFLDKSKLFEETISTHVLSSYDVQREDAKGKYIIRKLFQAFYANPQQLPNHCVFEFLNLNYDEYTEENILDIVKNKGIGAIRSQFMKKIEELNNGGNMEKNELGKINLMRVICDYIAGMTDSYANKKYDELYG